MNVCCLRQVLKQHVFSVYSVGSDQCVYYVSTHLLELKRMAANDNSGNIHDEREIVCADSSSQPPNHHPSSVVERHQSRKITREACVRARHPGRPARCGARGTCGEQGQITQRRCRGGPRPKVGP